jgi:hypothetical protein
MQQALDALKHHRQQTTYQFCETNAAIKTLEVELAKPEQEPVAWQNAAIRLGEDLYFVGPNGYYEMTAKQWLDWALSVVNTAPTKREWVGLADDVVAMIEKTVVTRKQAIKMIEHHLKELNT